MPAVTMTDAVPANKATQYDAPRPGQRTTVIQTRLMLATIMGLAAD
jgi:hypothetical protein